jgi:hypothetical protein
MNLKADIWYGTDPANGSKNKEDKMAKLVVYNDKDYHGDFYTVYENGKCIGAYLPDDEELKQMVLKYGDSVEFRDGIDNS